MEMANQVLQKIVFFAEIAVETKAFSKFAPLYKVWAC